MLDEYPNALGVGIDKSEEALKIARINQGNRIATLLRKDFFQRVWTQDLKKFDLIVSNPPYIPTKEIETLSPDVRDYDPVLALDGGADGLDAYRALANSVADILLSGGYLFLEVGQGQAKKVISLFEKRGLTYSRTFCDYGGIERIISFKKD